MLRTLAALIFCLAALWGAAKAPMVEYLKNQEKAPRIECNVFNAREFVDSLATGALIEGIWQMTADSDAGAFAVVKDPVTSYFKMIVVDSPSRNVRPGAVMGVMLPAAAKGCFDAYIYCTASHNGRLGNPRRFTLRLDGDRLIIRPVKKFLKVNFWRWFPYMNRMNVSSVDDRDKNIDGALRIYPAPKIPHLGPIFL